MCAGKSQCYFRGSLPRCATQRMFLHGHSWILNCSFFQVEEPSHFQGLHPGRKGKAISGSHCTHNTPRPYETNYTHKGHTHNTTRHTQAHTTGTGPPICTGLPTAWVSGAGSSIRHVTRLTIAGKLETTGWSKKPPGTYIFPTPSERIRQRKAVIV